VSLLQQRAKALETEISHRKELEEALRKALRDLRSSEEALRRSEQELKDFVENSGDASRAKDEFLAMLGHELRNPLSPIVTALQLMRLRGDNSAPKERAIIERQVKHLVRLVDDLLDVSRVTRGKLELHREPIEIAEVIAKAVEMQGPLLEERAHQLTLDVPRSKRLRVQADSARLAQVFSNLLANAAKYTDPGGRIVVAAERVGDTIAVRVTDNGAGIDPRLMPHIFDLFIQAKQTLDRSQGGLGIGLTIVRNLVELHGGSVSAHSDGLGRGSEFVVELPALDRKPSSGPAVPRVPAGPKATSKRLWRSLRVLVVDDNEDAAMLVTETLQDMGYEARQVSDGPSALLAAEQFHPHAAVLDIGLPGMDGYELARRLAAAHAGIRLIALTGYGQLSDRRLSAEAGFVEHMVKPLSLERLSALLDGMDKAVAASTR
jgi:signal transduction histidine kinase/ActR/RegA family two-component response regulator